MPSYFSKMNSNEKQLFNDLFNNPLNKYVENVRKLQPTGQFMEEKLTKICISLSNVQDNFLDEMDMKYF